MNDPSRLSLEVFECVCDCVRKRVRARVRVCVRETEGGGGCIHVQRGGQSEHSCVFACLLCVLCFHVCERCRLAPRAQLIANCILKVKSRFGHTHTHKERRSVATIL